MLYKIREQCMQQFNVQYLNVWKLLHCRDWTVRIEFRLWIFKCVTSYTFTVISCRGVHWKCLLSKLTVVWIKLYTVTLRRKKIGICIIRAGRCGIQIRAVTNFLILVNIRIGYGAHTATYLLGTWVLPVGKAAGLSSWPLICVWCRG
jgi:hypothetical protein